MDVRLPDGMLIKNVPDNMSKADLVNKLKANGHDVSGLESTSHVEQKPQGMFDNLSIKNIPQNLGNLAAGAVRGAGSIGATILAPADMLNDALAGKGLSLESNRARRADMDAGLQAMGADPKSGLYEAGKIGGEISGTAGMGNALAGAKVLSKAPELANAIRSGGFTLGTDATKGLATKEALIQALTRGGTRLAGGAANAGASTLLTTGSPQEALKGAEIGASIPSVAKVAGSVGSGASNKLEELGNYLMQSALKPTVPQQRSGEAARAVKTLLDEGINATKGGVEKLESRVSDINDNIKNIISNSDKTVNKQDVIDALNGTRSKFANQVSPTNDLNAIQGVQDDFTAHPNIIGSDIPVQQAQDLKQGTYSVLKGKFGETGSASTEAQKSLARGLKEQIALAHPEVGTMNARESDLLNALGITERRALLDANKNPLGLATLAHNPIAGAGMLADRSALVKSLLARGSNKLSKVEANSELAKLLIEQATPKMLPIMATQ